MDLSKIPGRKNDDPNTDPLSAGSPGSSSSPLPQQQISGTQAPPLNHPQADNYPPAPGQPYPGSPHGAPQQQYAQAPSASDSAANAYFDLVIGALLLLIFPRFWQWASDCLFGTSRMAPWALPDGTIIPYMQANGGYDFNADLTIAIYAVALVICGLSTLFIKRTAMQWVSIAILAIATAYNAFFMITTYASHGLAIVSFLATAFGSYQVWFFFQQVRGPGRRHA